MNNRQQSPINAPPYLQNQQPQRPNRQPSHPVLPMPLGAIQSNFGPVAVSSPSQSSSAGGVLGNNYPSIQQPYLPFQQSSMIVGPTSTTGSSNTGGGGMIAGGSGDGSLGGLSLPPITSLLFAEPQQQQLQQQQQQQPQHTNYQHYSSSSNLASGNNERNYPSNGTRSPPQTVVYPSKPSYSINPPPVQNYYQPTPPVVQAPVAVVEKEPDLPEQELPPSRPINPSLDSRDGDNIRVTFDSPNPLADFNVVSDWLQISEFIACFMPYFRSIVGVDMSMALDRKSPSLKPRSPTRDGDAGDDIMIVDSPTVVADDAEVDLSSFLEENISAFAFLSISSSSSTAYFRVLLMELLSPLVFMSTRDSDLIQILSDVKSRSGEMALQDVLLCRAIPVEEETIGAVLKMYLLREESLFFAFTSMYTSSVAVLDCIMQCTCPDLLDCLDRGGKLHIILFLMHVWLSLPRMQQYIESVFYPSLTPKHAKMPKVNKAKIQAARNSERDISYVRKDLDILRKHADEVRGHLSLMESSAEPAESEVEKMRIFRNDLNILEAAIKKKEVEELELIETARAGAEEIALANTYSSKVASEKADSELLMFFIQNQPIGLDRNSRPYFVLQTVNGVTMSDSNGRWCRYASVEDARMLQSCLGGSAERTLKDWVGRWLARDDASDYFAPPSDFMIRKVPSCELSMHKLIVTLFHAIIRISFAPTIKHTEKKKYAHFSKHMKRMRFLAAGDALELPFEELRSYVAEGFKAIAASEKSDTGKSKSTKKRNLQYSPVLFCFTDHEVEHVKPSDLKTIEMALMKIPRLLSSCKTLDEILVLVMLVHDTIMTNIDDEEAYRDVSDEQFNSWRDRVPAAQKASRATVQSANVSEESSRIQSAQESEDEKTHNSDDEEQSERRTSRSARVSKRAKSTRSRS